MLKVLCSVCERNGGCLLPSLMRLLLALLEVDVPVLSLMKLPLYFLRRQPHGLPEEAGWDHGMAGGQLK
jgi:hypothetical protein